MIKPPSQLIMHKRQLKYANLPNNLLLNQHKDNNNMLNTLDTLHKKQYKFVSSANRAIKKFWNNNKRMSPRVQFVVNKRRDNKYEIIVSTKVNTNSNSNKKVTNAR